LQQYPGFVIGHWFRNRSITSVDLVSDTLTFVDLDAPSPVAGALAGEPIHSYVEAEVSELASDGTRTTVTRRYTQAGGDVRWLFDEPDADPEAALAELRAAGMQTDFQLVSFPQRDIDVTAETPDLWESFSRLETGSLSGDERSGYAIYTSSNGTAELLVYSWVRLDEGAFPGLAAWYAATGPVAPGVESLVGSPPAFITTPDLRLDVYTADDSFARVLASTDTTTDDRAVYVVQRDGDVWFHSVVALGTTPDLNIPTNFASSLPFVAV
jgi:hypothetical protein